MGKTREFWYLSLKAYVVVCTDMQPDSSRDQLEELIKEVAGCGWAGGIRQEKDVGWEKIHRRRVG